jgi:hypothetical protein
VTPLDLTTIKSATDATYNSESPFGSVVVTMGALARRARFRVSRPGGGTAAARSGGYSVEKRIGASLILDGTLQALAAQVQTAFITSSLQIGPLVITAANVADNSLTIGVDAFTSGSIASLNVGGVEPHQRVIQSAVISRAAKRVAAHVAFDMSGASATAAFAVQLERTIGGTTTVVRKVFLHSDPISEAVYHHNLTLVDTSTVTGSATYAVRVLAQSPFIAYARTLVLEQKLK